MKTEKLVKKYLKLEEDRFEQWRIFAGEFQKRTGRWCDPQLWRKEFEEWLRLPDSWADPPAEANFWDRILG